MKRALTALALLAAISTSASAFSFDDIRNWVGTGSNRAALVMDWNDGTAPEALAWGYRWDGAATGLQMLNAINAADPLLSVAGSTSQFGFMVEGISYGSTHDETNADDWSLTWSYWVSNGSASPTWASSWEGATTRALANDSWDGWSFTAWDALFNPITEPGIAAAAPVPEPASLLALAGGLMSIGGLAIRRRMR